MNQQPTLAEIKNTLPQAGTVRWIGLRPGPRQDVQAVDSVVVDPETGLIGDHYKGRSKTRQVTLIQEEHLEAVGKLLQRSAPLEPQGTRRNIVVAGVNLQAFRKQQFTVGEVVLEMTGDCAPCSRMEENFGPGGYNAMRGHGGICARVIKGGTIHLGDPVRLHPIESNK